MSYYVDKQYENDLSYNAKRDLNILFFKSFFRDSKKILDVGCSIGRVISLDPKRIKGIDIDGSALKRAKNKGYEVKRANIENKLPFKKESFDGIFCSHVIEHLEEPLKAIKEMRRILKYKGRLVVITPDYMKTMGNYKNNFWRDYTHKRPFIPESLKRLAHDSGFMDFRIYYFPGKGFRSLLRRGILTKKKWIKIQRHSFVWKGQDLILEAIK